MGWSKNTAMKNNPPFLWNCRDRVIQLGSQTHIMGILNTTPDSFSDGGLFLNPDQAASRAIEMIQQGATFIDIGGESSRPGAKPISTTEELSRTLPVIQKIRETTDVLISIDTTKAQVAEAALDAGAHIINDISALEADPQMVHVAEKFNAGVILMHRQGPPQQMQKNPTYSNVVSEICTYLTSRIQFCKNHGLHPNQLVIDPGIGFGKTVEHNVELLKKINQFHQINRPLLIGASRKSFIGHLLNKAQPTSRLAGSLGVAAWATLQGAHILRVHDIIETCDICSLLRIISSDV